MDHESPAAPHLAHPDPSTESIVTFPTPHLSRLLLAVALVLGTAPSHGYSGRGLTDQLIEIRSISGRLARVKAYDALVDDITRPAPLARGRAAEAPQQLMDEDTGPGARMTAATARKLKRLANDMAAILKCSADLEFEFRETEKRRLQLKVEPSVRRCNEWRESSQATQIVREHGADLGEGFILLYIGQRKAPTTLVAQDNFFYALIYDGKRKWKLAQLSWELQDLLGETISTASGKFTPGELSGKVHLFNTTTSILAQEQRDHVKNAQDGRVERVSEPRVVWDER